MKREKQQTNALRVFGRRTLTLEITIIIVMVVILVSGSSLILNLRAVSQENEMQFIKKSNEYLSYLKESLELPLWTYDNASITKLAQMMMSNDIVSSLTIKDNKGNPIFTDKKQDEVEFAIKNESILYRGLAVGFLELGLTKRLYHKQQKRIVIVGMVTTLVVIMGVLGVVILSVIQFIKKPR